MTLVLLFETTPSRGTEKVAVVPEWPGESRLI